MLKACLILLVAALGCSTPPSGDGDPATCDTSTDTLTDVDIVARLETNVERARAHADAAGVVSAIEMAGERWVGAAGFADLSADEPLERDDHLRIGSITKTFTGALIFQLRDQGLLSLDDLLDRWVPGYWDGHGITVRNLLAHTSGIVSYNYVGNFDDSRPWAPIDMVAYAHQQGPDLKFVPGTQWDYSNTGFVLLGLIAEAATGQPYAQLLRERFFEPLQLNNTFVEGDEELRCGLVRGYEGTPPRDATNDIESFGWAAGAIVSNGADLARWGSALYRGEVLSPSSLSEMVSEVVLPDGTPTAFGLGTFSSVDGDYGASYGHTGGTDGFVAYMIYMPDYDTTTVALVNHFGVDVETAATFGWAAVLDLEFNP